MGNIFTITTATTDIKTDASGKASAIFTATNTSNKPLRGMARARSMGSTQQGWLEVEGETEKDFAAGGTQQFTVNVKFTGPEAGKFPFRLDVASANNPDEEFTEGPAVTVETAAPAAPVKKGFPVWLIIVIAAAALLIVGLILFLVLRAGGGDSSSSENNSNSNNNKPITIIRPTNTNDDAGGRPKPIIIGKPANSNGDTGGRPKPIIIGKPANTSGKTGGRPKPIIIGKPNNTSGGRPGPVRIAP